VDAATGRLSTFSKTAYVEVHSPSGMVQTAKLALDAGRGAGRLNLPTTLPTGNYQIFAYTQLGAAEAGFDPLPGPFRVPMLPDGEGWCHTAVPAQRDGSLCLCVYRFGELERIFSLGEYILDSGYDWQAEELEDIRMEIDYVLGAVRFKVEQWSKTLYFFVAV
jgi:hypothetical protein